MSLRRTVSGTLWLVVIPCVACGQLLIGISGGAGKTSFSGDAPDKVQYTSRTGFRAAVVAEIPLGDDIRLSVQPCFARQGTGIAFDVGLPENHDSLDLALDYLRIPVMARFVAPKGVWFVNGGVDLGFLLDASLDDVNAGGTIDVTNTIGNMDLAMIFGVGFQVSARPVIFTLELRYSQSVLNAGSNSAAESVYGIPVRFRSSGFELLAGALIPL
jgi:hypothetical protein